MARNKSWGRKILSWTLGRGRTGAFLPCVRMCAADDVDQVVRIKDPDLSTSRPGRLARKVDYMIHLLYKYVTDD